MVEKLTGIAAVMQNQFNVKMIKDDKLKQFLGSREPTEQNVIKTVFSSPIEEVSQTWLILQSYFSVRPVSTSSLKKAATWHSPC